MAFSVTSSQTTDGAVTINKIIQLTLADASNFVVGGDITGDNDNANDGIGTIQSKSGNVVNVIVTSGIFVSGNGVDNVNPFVGDETVVSTVDSTYFEIGYTKRNKQHNAILSYVNYTKGTETNIVLEMARLDENICTDFYFESIDDGTGILASYEKTIEATSKLVVPWQVGKNEESIIIKLTAQDPSSDGVVDINIAENNFSV